MAEAQQSSLSPDPSKALGSHHSLDWNSTNTRAWLGIAKVDRSFAQAFFAMAETLAMVIESKSIVIRG